MLFQLHHQSLKNPEKTIFCAQFEILKSSYKEERDFMNSFIDDAWENYPPPEGYQFMVCNENSKYFLKTN